jgi:PKD repeat protein
MTTYYVGTTGNDGNTPAQAQNSGTPWATVTHALSQMVAGDTVRVLAGTYNEAVEITNSGSAGNPITIMANPGDTVWFDGNNYALPSATDVTPGGTYAYGTWYAFHYKGMFHINASYITIDGINIRYSRGAGIHCYVHNSIPYTTPRLTNITVKNLTVEHVRNVGIHFGGVDYVTWENCVVYDAGNFAPFHRPSGAGIPNNHPGATSMTFCSHATIRDITVYGSWGEGIMLTLNVDDSTMDDCTVYDVMSGCIYLHRCQRVVANGCTAYYSDDSPYAASNRQSGILLDNEDPRYPSVELPCDDIVVKNCLVVGAETGLIIRGGNGGEFAFNNIRFYNNTIVNPRSDDGGDSAAIKIAAAAVVTSANIGNNVIRLSGAYSSAPASTPTNANVTWRYNIFSSQPVAAARGTGDIYADPLLNLPDAAVVAGALDPDHYLPGSASPARLAGVTIAEVTDDYFDDARSAPYWMGFSQTDSGGGGGSSTAANIAIGVAQNTIAQSTGNTSFTDTNFGGGTPEFALVVANAADSISGGIATEAHSILSIGFYDGTTSVGVGIRAKDGSGVANTDVRTRGSTTNALVVLKTGSTSVEGQLSGNGFIANGVQLNAAVAPTATLNAIATLIGGSDFQAKCGTLSFASGDTTKTISSLSFTSNLIIIIGVSNASIDDSTYSGECLSIGLATSTSTQKSLTHRAYSGLATSDVRCKIYSDRIACNAADDQWHAITAINSTGFTVTRTGVTGAKDFIWAAMRIDNASIFLGTDTMPLATGTKTHSVGFEPAYMLMIQSLLQSLDSAATNADANSFGVGMTTPSVRQSMSYTDEDAQTTQDTESVYANVPVKLRTTVGNDGFVAAYSAVTTSGFTLNYTTVAGTAARYAIVAAIEKTITREVMAEFSGTPLTLVEGNNVTFTDASTDTNTTITSWAWNFGDGGTSTSQNPVHTYTAAGTYSVTLSVSDGTISDEETKTNYITVTAAPPVAPSQPKLIAGSLVEGAPNTGPRAVGGFVGG